MAALPHGRIGGPMYFLGAVSCVAIWAARAGRRWGFLTMQCRVEAARMSVCAEVAVWRGAGVREWC